MECVLEIMEMLEVGKALQPFGVGTVNHKIQPNFDACIVCTGADV